ncbi:MAG: hypothetical protein E7256_04305 [Lachnospiraceae bacterium]|nr:hypothetical protein [Lachnospiraceae bacterium]
MKKKLIAALVITVSCFTMFEAGMKAGAAQATPGSSGDPLITQSYLEAQLENVEGASYKKVNLAKGKTLKARQGTEFVIYSGSGTVTGSGLINLTSGELFERGMSAVMYSHYLSPASGCGVKAAGSMVIFIKGNYTIE